MFHSYLSKTTDPIPPNKFHPKVLAKLLQVHAVVCICLPALFNDMTSCHFVGRVASFCSFWSCTKGP